MNELIQIGPISPMCQRLIDDMTMRRCWKETQRNYLRDVARFASRLGRSPHTASAEDVRQFQIEQQQALPTCPHYPDTMPPARRMDGTDHAFRNP